MGDSEEGLEDGPLLGNERGGGLRGLLQNRVDEAHQFRLFPSIIFRKEVK